MNAPPATEPSRAVLVVDDDPGTVRLLVETLRAEPFDVWESGDPLQALEHVRRETFATVITDQKMPRMTGLELLGHIKALQPDASRVLLTGVVDVSIVTDAINRGEIYRFIVKPWMREELLATVRDAVHRFGLVRQNAALQTATLDVSEQLAQANRSLEEALARERAEAQRLERLNHTLEQQVSALSRLSETVLALLPETQRERYRSMLPGGDALYDARGRRVS